MHRSTPRTSVVGATARRAALAVGAAVAVAGLAGCGQKGPLFLGAATPNHLGTPVHAASGPVALPPLPPPPVRP